MVKYCITVLRAVADFYPGLLNDPVDNAVKKRPSHPESLLDPKTGDWMGCGATGVGRLRALVATSGACRQSEDGYKMGAHLYFIGRLRLTVEQVCDTLRLSNRYNTTRPSRLVNTSSVSLSKCLAPEILKRARTLGRTWWIKVHFGCDWYGLTFTKESTLDVEALGCWVRARPSSATVIRGLPHRPKANTTRIRHLGSGMPCGKRRVVPQVAVDSVATARYCRYDSSLPLL